MTLFDLYDEQAAGGGSAAAVLDPPAEVSAPTPAAMPAAPVPSITPAEAVNINERTVCLALTLSKLGNRRKVSTSAVQVDADKDQIAVSKMLLDCEEVKAVEKLDSELRTWLYGIALPSMFKEGIYRVSVQAVQIVENKLREFEGRRADLVDRLCDVYDMRVREAAGRLRGVFNRRDYGGAAEVRAAYRIEWSYISFGVPGQLQSISGAMFESEREKFSAKLVEAADECRQVLRAAMAELVSHMVDRLAPGADGGRRIFRNSLVENLREFLGTFDLRNVTDDAELQALVTRARALLAGSDAESLRDSSILRERVRAGMGEIKARLDSMMVDRPARAISFDEE